MSTGAQYSRVPSGGALARPGAACSAELWLPLWYMSHGGPRPEYVACLLGSLARMLPQPTGGLLDRAAAAFARSSAARGARESAAELLGAGWRNRERTQRGLRAAWLVACAGVEPPPAALREVRRVQALGPLPLPRAVWGPAVWRLLHAVSAGRVPGRGAARAYRVMLACLTKLLPCEECRAHVRDNLSRVPEAPEGCAGLFEWSWGLHNLVNSQLGKPRMPLEQARRMYAFYFCGAGG